MMSRLPYLLIVALLVCPRIGLAQNGSEFAGTWTMDTLRSDSASPTSPSPLRQATQVITSLGDELRIETIRDGSHRVSKFPLPDVTNPEDLKAVGTSGETGVGTIDRLGFATLDTMTPILINDKSVTIIEKRQLSQDGKEMTIETSVAVQHGYDGKGMNYSLVPVKDVYIRSAN